MPLTKAPNRIRYVLPVAQAQPGHRLGINSLALDTTTPSALGNGGNGPRGILYTAGRDGMVSAWDLNLQLKRRDSEEANGPVNGEIIDDDGNKTTLLADGRKDRARGWDVDGTKIPPTRFRADVQAHTHWVNDILLAHESQSVISCSSDMTVKLWRPHSLDQGIPNTLGNHADYVKCLASPGDTSDWVASGGLDRNIILWDLNGKGEIQRIAVGEGSEGPKGSVYALGTGGGILASGGPEKVVRIWDPKSGKRITKFVGHTDNVRSILLSDDGRTMLTASSDTTIKLWSLATRRCLHTFTMHADSVWALHSLHPRLEVFHAGDRGGLVTKTDIRGVTDIDDAECVAVYKEHHGITKIVSVGNRLWSATSSSSINRWLDTPDWDPIPPSGTIHHRTSSASRHRPSSAPTPSHPTIPAQAFLRLTSVHDTMLQMGPISHKDQDVASIFSAAPPSPQQHVPHLPEEPYHIIPVRVDPDATIAGQHGLIKHILLNDRRRVLTLDTSHKVALWDIVECKHLQSYGTTDIYEVEKQVNSNENIPNWCTVDTRIGSITVMLDERSAFDAEIYRDEMGYKDEDDQRINIGKWVLRYLFANLIEAELAKDRKLRGKLEGEIEEKRKKEENVAAGNPLHISIPPPVHLAGDSMPRGRAPEMSPAIGLATPAPTFDFSPGRTTILSESEYPVYSANRGRKANNSYNKDYFSNPHIANGEESALFPATPNPQQEVPGSAEHTRESTFMGRLKSFGAKKLTAKLDKADDLTSPAANGTEKEDDKSDDHEPTTANGNAEPSAAKDKPYMFTDVLSAVRKTYESALSTPESSSDKGSVKDQGSVTSISKIPVLEDGKLRSALTPSSSDDTPPLRPSPNTIIIIAEPRFSVDGSMDLYRGTVASVGKDMEILESIAPGWLGELLLLDKLPKKEIVKISFSLKPHSTSSLPDMLAGNSRLNANRMLRARKVVAYIAERIESDLIPKDKKDQPDMWLELLCQEKVVPPKWTLQTIRTQMWRQGGDVLFTYRLKSEQAAQQETG